MVNFLKNILNKIETLVLSRKKRDFGDSDDDENLDKDESLDVSLSQYPQMTHNQRHVFSFVTDNLLFDKSSYQYIVTDTYI